MRTRPIFKSPQGREAILAVYDQILGRWPLPFETHMIPTRHGETFVLTCGDEAAPPLVLLHGSAANSAIWVGDADVYGTCCRMIAIDFPGEPGKSQAVRCNLYGTDCAEWLHEVLAALALDRVTLLGISLGGWMALKFATHYPERVEKLALLCPGGVAPEKNLFMLKAFPLMFLGEWGAGKFLGLLNAGQPLHPETIRYTYLISKHFNPRLKGGSLFTDQELKRLTMPVLLLAGAKDPLIDTRNTAARLGRLLPCLHTEILPEAGHMLANMAGCVMPFLSQE
jgi:pimeloyl-ACP methyl ester carboxylesterase